MAARKSVQKLLEETRELRPGPAQRAAYRRLDPRADHPARNRDLTLQALAELALGLQLGLQLFKLLDSSRKRRQIEAVGLDDTPLSVSAAPPFAIRAILERDHTDLCQTPRMTLECRQREAGLFHQIGVRGPDDRALPLLPVLGLREGPQCIEEHHVAGLQTDMRSNALERDKCPRLGYCYPFTGLGKLLSNPKTRCRLAPTCMFHACISPPVVWRQKKAVRSEAFVVDSESCETYLEGDQTIKISSQATPLGGFSVAVNSLVVPFLLLASSFRRTSHQRCLQSVSFSVSSTFK